VRLWQAGNLRGRTCFCAEHPATYPTHAQSIDPQARLEHLPLTQCLKSR